MNPKFYKRWHLGKWRCGGSISLDSFIPKRNWTYLLSSFSLLMFDCSCHSLFSISLFSVSNCTFSSCNSLTVLEEIVKYSLEITWMWVRYLKMFKAGKKSWKICHYSHVLLLSLSRTENSCGKFRTGQVQIPTQNWYNCACTQKGLGFNYIKINSPVISSVCLYYPVDTQGYKTCNLIRKWIKAWEKKSLWIKAQGKC